VIARRRVAISLLMQPAGPSATVEPVLGDDLSVIDGASAGAWIKPHLGGEFGAVTLQIPKGLEAYARIFHPASDPKGNPVSWAEVAEAVGSTAHREMQWHALVGSSATYGFTGSRWAGGEPSLGEMDLDELEALCEILTVHSANSEDCFFGLCEIWSWVNELLPEGGRKQPRLELPLGRNHVVLRGPLSAVNQIGNPRPVARHAPQLIWPADRTWLVVSEVDFDSTLVGGSSELIQAIVESPELEAWRVEPADSLAADADKVNLALENDT
jgi:hypothetical protein